MVHFLQVCMRQMAVVMWQGPLMGVAFHRLVDQAKFMVLVQGQHHPAVMNMTVTAAEPLIPSQLSCSNSSSQVSSRRSHPVSYHPEKGHPIL
mmetsp:Transcript_5991/g.9075  ORF Transcript_5991/g.9075 Transcript_5991/m.9075 type:complete len:92 (-) Transcript_5991:793-1068(-)